MDPLITVNLVIVVIGVPVCQVVIHNHDLRQSHSRRVEDKLLVLLVLRPILCECLFRLIRTLIHVCPGLIRTEVELVLRGLWLCLEVLLVRHSWVLLLRVLALRYGIRGLPGLLAIFDQLLVSCRAHHSIPVPGQEEDAHAATEQEDSDLFPHDPGEIAGSIVRLRHATLLRMLVSVPFDGVELDWVLSIWVPLEHFIELRIMLLPVPFLEWDAFRATSIRWSWLSCHLLKVATLLILLIATTASVSAHIFQLFFCS